MHSAQPPRTAPLALWRVAEAFLHVLHTLFGAPEDVARAHTLTRAAYTLLVSWMRVGEALLRRLIAIEAAAFAPIKARAPSPHRTRQRRTMAFFADNPEDWRVSFPACPSMLRQAQHDAEVGAAGSVSVSLSLSKAKRHAGFHSAWPLAERYEALIRVFNEPHAYARRLAHRLHARPRLLRAVLHEPEHYTTRVDNAEAIDVAVQRAWPTPNSS